MRKDFATAERHFMNVLSIRPQHSAALNNLAWLMAERGDKGAVAVAERAQALEPNAPPVMDTLAHALAMDGQLERAIEVQKKALVAMPERHEYRWNLAKLFVKNGKKSDAERELEVLARVGTDFARQAEVAALLKEVRK